MRWFLVAALAGAALWLIGRRGRSDRGSTELAVDGAIAALGGGLLDVAGDVTKGGQAIWDAGVSATGAAQLDGGGKGAAVLTTRGTQLGAPPAALASGERAAGTS